MLINVGEELDFVRRDLIFISEEIHQNPLKERLLKLSRHVETLIQTFILHENSSLRKKSGDEVSNRKLEYEDLEGEENLSLSNMSHDSDVGKMAVVQPDLEALRSAEDHVRVYRNNQGYMSHQPNCMGRCSSPSYEDVDKLFKDDPQNVTQNSAQNFQGVSAMFLGGVNNHTRGMEFRAFNKEFQSREPADLKNQNPELTHSYGGIKEHLTPKSSSHGRKTSFGGVMQIHREINDDGLNGIKLIEVDLDDNLSNCDTGSNDWAINVPVRGEVETSQRRVSFGGVKSVDVSNKAAKLQTTHNPGPENVEQNLSFMRNGGVFSTPFGEDIGSSKHVQIGPEGRMMVEDLAREHLNLKESKIELIRSTAKEIDRLRGLVKLLAGQLKKNKVEQERVSSTTFGGQVLVSVSEAFGVVSSMFSVSEQEHSERD